MKALEEGHEELHRRRDEVLAAFRAAESADLGDADWPATIRRLRRAYQAHAEVLDEHLDLEEETVIPLLLELEPDEFADYYFLTLPELLRKMEG